MQNQRPNQTQGLWQWVTAIWKAIASFLGFPFPVSGRAVSFALRVSSSRSDKHFLNIFELVRTSSVNGVGLTRQRPVKVTIGSNLSIQIVDIKDALGNPTMLKSVPEWQTSDSSVLTLSVSADGLTATGKVSKTGSVTVTASADGITASASVDVQAGDAVTFSLQVSVVPVPPTSPAPAV